MNATTRTHLAAAAAAALALAGAACSGETGASDAPASARQEALPERDASARLATAEFRVDGMTCGGCALATEMAVKKLDGVASADAEFDKATGEGRCTVEFDPSAVDTDAIAAAIEKAGFTPTLSSGASAETPPRDGADGR